MKPYFFSQNNGVRIGPNTFNIYVDKTGCSFPSSWTPVPEYDLSFNFRFFTPTNCTKIDFHFLALSWPTFQDISGTNLEQKRNKTYYVVQIYLNKTTTKIPVSFEDLMWVSKSVRKIENKFFEL